MTRALVLGGVVVGLLLMVAVPLGVLLAWLATAPNAALAAVIAPANLEATANTAVLSAAVVATTLALGVPLGFLVGRSDLPARRFWRAACTMPFVVPPYVTAIAWMTLLNPTTGVLNAGLARVGLGPVDVYTIGGMTLVMGLSFTPLVMMATADALGRMDASLEEQARIAGAGPWRTLFRVTLPLALPGIAEGAAFVLAAAAASFGVPYLLASNASDPPWVLTTRIYHQLSRPPADGLPVAVGLSLVLLVLGLGVPALARAVRGRRQFTTVTGKATRVAPFPLGRGRPFAVAAVAVFVAVAVLLPVGTILVTSLQVNVGRGLAWTNFTLGNYVAVLWQRSDTLASVRNSAILAAGTATVATVLGALIAWMRRRTNTPGRVQIAALARLPYAIPGTVLALGLFLAYGQEVRFILFERVTLVLALANTLWFLGLAYLVKLLVFPVGNADAGLQALDPALEESARMSGASWARTLWVVTVPLLRPHLVAAWFLVFLPAFSEVTMSILLAGPDTGVIGTTLFDLQTYDDPTAAAVLAMVVVAVVLGGNTLLRAATRGRVGL